MSTSRNTRKSRIVNSVSEALVDLYREDGVHAPTKGQIVDRVVDNSLVAGVDLSVRQMLETEMSNALETYFAEICKQASAELGLPFHYTSKAYYRRGIKPPESMQEAFAFIVAFGNGRTGKAAGVRFVTPDDEPDPMLLAATKREMDVIQTAFKTQRDRLAERLEHPAMNKPVHATIVRNQQVALPTVD
jgi:hypothetical protein